jgi:hypothetical protein
MFKKIWKWLNQPKQSKTTMVVTLVNGNQTMVTFDCDWHWPFWVSHDKIRQDVAISLNKKIGKTWTHWKVISIT